MFAPKLFKLLFEVDTSQFFLLENSALQATLLYSSWTMAPFPGHASAGGLPYDIFFSSYLRLHLASVSESVSHCRWPVWVVTGLRLLYSCFRGSSL